MSFFFFNDTAPTEIYTLSLHDALPIWPGAFYAQRSMWPRNGPNEPRVDAPVSSTVAAPVQDRKSTRLNSSHPSISYAVFCLKKKKQQNNNNIIQQEEDNQQTLQRYT